MERARRRKESTNEEERAAWRENASKLPTEALVFLDECGSSIAVIFPLMKGRGNCSSIFEHAAVGILVVAQIYRYRTVSTPVQRQQTKWVVFAITTIILVELVLTVPGLIFFQPESPYSLIAANITLFVLLLGPVALYIAIMRYRLYDIDIIINRTLVYGSLTTLLVLIYVGLISEAEAREER